MVTGQVFQTLAVASSHVGYRTGVLAVLLISKVTTKLNQPIQNAVELMKWICQQAVNTPTAETRTCLFEGDLDS